MGIRSYGRRMLALASLVGTLEAHADDGTDATSADRTGTLPLF